MAEKFCLSRKGEPDMKRLMFLGASFAAFAVSAAEYTWVNGSENWDSPASYRDSQGNVPGTPPGGGDSLKIVSSAVEIAAGDSAALNRLNSIGYVTLSSSTLTLNCNADMELKCGLYSDKDESACVVKTGDGTLVLSAKGKSPSDEGCYYDAYVDFDIHEGVLKFYQGLDLDKTMCVRDIAIGAEAACWMVNTKKLMVENLRGEGLLTNDCDNANDACLNLHGKNGCFSGRVNGKFTLYIEGGRTDFLCEDNNLTETVLISGGTVGLKRIGDSSSPGSAGKNALTTREGSGTVVYLGEGEQTSRTFTSLNRPSKPMVFDAGAHGGLDMSGGFAFDTNEVHNGMYHLTLTGSNTEQCVLWGDITSHTSPVTKTNYTYCVTKDGSGTWYLKDPTNRVGRSFGGVVEVKKGTLKFDSVGEKGVATSLGTASNLSKQKTGYPRYNSQSVSYAYVLGNGTTEGLMEFVGTNNCRTTTRPAVLSGTGVLVNNSANSELRFRGVSAMTAGPKTLVLDGTNTLENIVWDVTDGDGTVSVEKRGSGTWVLGGTNSFSGSLDVKEGTLVVRNDKGAPYKWFKLVIREIASSRPGMGPGSKQTDDTEKKRIDFVEWGIYDADGKRLNVNTDKADVYNKPFRTLRPLQIAIGKDASISAQGSYANGTWRGPGELVDKFTDSMQVVVGSKAPVFTTPGTWVPVVMRLPDAAGTVGSFDVFYRGDIQTDDYRGRFPTSFALEGSVDGYSWEPIYETNDVVKTEFGWFFAKDANDKTGMGDRHGCPIRGIATNNCVTLSNASTVRVASGATLKLEGDVVISDVTVDCDKGAGTIDGGRFAENGTLRVEGSFENGAALSLSCVNTQTLGNLASWNVDVAGRNNVYKAKVDNQGVIRLFRPAFALVIR